MITKVKALIWEECRTGGVIALWCWIMASVIMLALRVEMGSEILGKDPMSFLTIVGGLPIIAAALLVLNPDHKGALHGGFSTRILELPVPTFIPVAIALLFRILFVFWGTILTIAVSLLLFSDAPSLQLALYITVLYMLMQLFDWMRFPVSGLTSILALLSALFIIMYLASGGNQWSQNFFDDLPGHWYNLSEIVLTKFLLFLLLVYALSVIAVRTTRIGRRYGIPEIWEWHKRLDLPTIGSLKPFDSPMHAQVWLDLRKSLFLLPIVTAVVTLGYWLVGWLTLAEPSAHNPVLHPFIPLIGLLAGALVHGAKTGILGYRSAKGMAGYTFIQPMTHAQFATARMISNALLLLPTIAIVMLLHFATMRGHFVTEIIPEALNAGLTSPKEIAWVLLSRGIILTLVAWALLTIATRQFLFIAALAFSFYMLLEIIGIPSRNQQAIFSFGVSLSLIILCAVSYFRAWRNHLISTRPILFWGSTWTLITWIIYGQSAIVLSELSAAPTAHFVLACTSTGIAALAPLPFISTLLDMRKKRHSAAPKQNHKPSNVPLNWKSVSTPVKISAVTFLCVFIFGIWLGTPNRPAWESKWRSNGYPVTLTELNDWYPAVPDDENRALEYLSSAELRNQKENEFYTLLNKKSGRDLSAGERRENIMIAGSARVLPNKPVPKEVREATEEYWRLVTSHIAPDLKKIASEKDNMKSRYPMDLSLGFVNVDHKHHREILLLANELKVDALYWIMNNDAEKATDSILAIFPIVDSLENEPLFVSEMYQNWILNNAYDALDDLINRMSLTEQDLARLQLSLETQSSAFRNTPVVNRTMVGESTMAMNGVGRYPFFSINAKYSTRAATQIPLTQLMYPASAEYAALGLIFEDIITTQQLNWREYSRKLDENDRLEEPLFIAPMASVMGRSAYSRHGESSRRLQTQFQLATTAIAVQRYRLKNNTLPKTLNDLIPQYLEAIPEDYFAGPGNPIKYRIRENNAYTIYSVGRDMEDDHGEKLKVITSKGDLREKFKNRKIEGDITFTVFPQIPDQPQ